MADSILFEKFIKYYPSIDEIKDYKGEDEMGSLAFLKDFYTKVWGAFDEYVENDVMLYNLFNKDKYKDINDLAIKARVGILNSMYSTQINKIGKIIEIINESKKGNEYSETSTNEALDKIKEYNNEPNNKEGKKINEVQSFFSKYFHWYNEVNYLENALPIYDLNVLVGAFIYKEILKPDIKVFNFKRKNFKNIFGIGGFVNNDKALDLKYVGNNCKKKIDYLKLKEKYLDLIIKSLKIENKIINLEDPTKDSQKNCLYENISIYRLVDKFLWLTYKIAEQLTEAEKIDKNNTKGKNKILNQTVPIKVKINYLNLLLETKKNTPSDLKNKIINYLNLLKNTSKDQDLLENIEEKIQYLNLLLDTSKDQDLLKKDDKISLQQN